jgi:hypothetical protein
VDVEIEEPLLQQLHLVLRERDERGRALAFDPGRCAPVPAIDLADPGDYGPLRRSRA